jgi:hypothetical protein
MVKEYFKIKIIDKNQSSSSLRQFEQLIKVLFDDFNNYSRFLLTLSLFKGL